MKDIYEFYKTIETKSDFEHFLFLLKEKYKKDKVKGEHWENNTLEQFLDSMYYSNQNTTPAENLREVSWKDFAVILLTAIVYE